MLYVEYDSDRVSLGEYPVSWLLLRREALTKPNKAMIHYPNGQNEIGGTLRCSSSPISLYVFHQVGFSYILGQYTQPLRQSRVSFVSRQMKCKQEAGKEGDSVVGGPGRVTGTVGLLLMISMLNPQLDASCERYDTM